MQKELAAVIMCSESSIAKYKQELVEIPNPFLMGIADFLDADAADLLDINLLTAKPSPFFAIFRRLEPPGYKVVMCGKKEYRSVRLRDFIQFQTKFYKT